MGLKLQFKLLDQFVYAANQFKDILVKLIYQSVHKQSFSLCEKPEQEIDSLIQEVNKQQKPNAVSEEGQRLLEKLQADGKYIFAGIGKWEVINPIDAKQNKVIFEECAFALCRLNKFDSEFRLLSLQGSVEVSKDINENLQFNIDEQDNSISWIGLYNKHFSCHKFTFLRPIQSQLTQILNILVLENKQQSDYQNILKKEQNDWDQYYLQSEGPLHREDREYLNKYSHNPRQVDFDSGNVHRYKDSSEINLHSLVQSTQNRLIFTGSEGLITVFKAQQGQSGLSKVNSVKIDKDQVPAKMRLLNNEDQILFINDGDGSAVLYDLNKQKTVQTFTGGKQEIRDLAKLNEKDYHNSGRQFVGVTQQRLLRFDPRDKKGVVAKKVYKSDP